MVRTDLSTPCPPSAAGIKYFCSKCAKTYSRSSHLRRHELIHTGEKASQCSLCSRWFVKTETARRHAISCARKHNATVPSEKKRGRKAQSCDRCARYKVSCDAGMPCARCRRSRGATCSYQRLQGAGAGTPEKTNVLAPFLSALTDPAYSCSAEAFAAVAGHDDAGVAVERHCDDGNSSASHQAQTSLLDTGALLSDWGLSPSLLDSHFDSVWDPPPCRTGSSHQLGIRLDKFVSQLSTTHAYMVSTGRSVPDFDVALVKPIFTIDNLAVFSRAFFSRFNRQMPIVHRPSLDLEMASAPLLLAIFVAGAVCASPNDDALGARGFIDIIEEYIFSQNVFRQYLHQGEGGLATEQSSADGVEALQAAVIMSSLQASMHSTVTRRRIRVQRLPSLVAAIRSLGLPAAKRRAKSGLSWRDFIADEVRVRIAIHAFLHDSYLCMFFNQPPLMLVSEMTGDLPCADELFEADTQCGFENLLTSPGQRTTVQSLSHLLKALVDEPSPQVQELLINKCVTRRHLALAISALQSSTFFARTNYLGLDSLNVLLRGTERWNALWEVATQRKGSDQITTTGFLEHAAEICWLVRAVIRTAQAGDMSFSYMRAVATDSLTELHEFIQQQKHPRRGLIQKSCSR